MSLAAEEYHDDALFACLTQGLAGAFQSRAVRQLLGHLGATTSTQDLSLILAKELQSSQWAAGYSSVTDVDAAGCTLSETQTRLPGELWAIVRVSVSGQSTTLLANVS